MLYREYFIKLYRMKKSLAVLLSCVICVSINAQSKTDILHYKFDLTLSDTSNSISGLATIIFKATAPTSFLELDFKELNSEKKGMEIIMLNTPRAPDISTTASPAAILYSHQHDRIKISLPHKLEAGETDTIAIAYKGVPADGLIISKTKHGKRSFFADNWPNRGHHWLPCNDEPVDKASVEFIVTAPDHYQVVANGVQVEETNLPGNKKRTHWKEDVPVSTKVMVIGVADFAVNLSGMVDDCIPVYSWVYPEDRDKGFYDYALAADILPFFIQNVGPYPYKKLANVQSKTKFGGLENANTIFYSENSVTGNRKSEALLVHEIAHQWFGNSATEKTFAHLWLSEGFATYMTILYMENKYGKDTALYMLKEDRQQVIRFARNSRQPVVDDTTDYMALLNPNSYQKGSWVLHMLRHEIGDSLFWKSIRAYYAAYGGKTADSDDFRKTVETVSGKNLESFFRQWLYYNGIPKLDIKWTYDEEKKKVKVTVQQLQKQGNYRFPIRIMLKNKNGSVQAAFKKEITTETETFILPAKSRPDAFLVDPDTHLLFEANIREKTH